MMGKVASLVMNLVQVVKGQAYTNAYHVRYSTNL